MISLVRFKGTIEQKPYLAASITALLMQLVLHKVVYHLVRPLGDGTWTFMFPAVTVSGYGGFAVGGGLASWSLLLVGVADAAAAWVLWSLAMRRARTTNRSLVIACLVVVPVFQIPTLCWLGWSARQSPDDSWPRERPVPLSVALQGLLGGVIVTVALEVLSTLVLRTYGLGLFVASPFIVGCVTGYLGNRAADIGWWDTVRLVLGACFLGCVALLAVAVEGIICLVMAAPLILVMAWVGGLVGRAIAIRRPGAARGGTALSIGILPLLLAVDLIAPPRVAFESVESVEVSAADRQVWDAIVHMGPIPSPPDMPFRWGLAYPLSGRIDGSGVGAIRTGVFSTGTAYERVTEWEPDRYLSFIVLSDPPTLRELSPYRDVHAPHVNGYFRTLDARFTITPLQNGHTRLTLATRHELDLGPGAYWLPMARWAVHTNKQRVLAHFATQAEVAAAASTAH